MTPEEQQIAPAGTDAHHEYPAIVIDEAARVFTGRARRWPTTTAREELLRRIIAAGRDSRVTTVENPLSARRRVRLQIQVATLEALGSLPSVRRQIALPGDSPLQKRRARRGGS